MEFNGQYLTYEEYKGLGGTLDLTPFNILEFKARREIDGKTQNRLVGTESINIPQAVKICEFDLMNSISGYAISKNLINEKGNIASENTDGYSVNYVSMTQVADIVKSQQAEVDNIIKTGLTNVNFNGQHLLYCGID